MTTGTWEDYAARVNTANWKECLVSAMVYSSEEELGAVCSRLGDRLKGQAAMLCYICAGDLDKVVECWMKTRDTDAGPKVRTKTEIGERVLSYRHHILCNEFDAQVLTDHSDNSIKVLFVSLFKGFARPCGSGDELEARRRI